VKIELDLSARQIAALRRQLAEPAVATAATKRKPQTYVSTDARRLYMRDLMLFCRRCAMRPADNYQGTATLALLTAIAASTAIATDLDPLVPAAKRHSMAPYAGQFCSGIAGNRP
jgi:hypothetical protein